ncbi:MAG: ATP-binding protein [Bacteroidales bacterium]|nr:ATP-binding protein [Bacteroidales bacterium]
MLERLLDLNEIKNDSLFLWGSRQTGKSTLLKTLFPKVKLYDLLKSDVRMAFQLRPALLREECEMMDEGEIVIIDEVQKVPSLLDEVHWLIENRGLRFILSGSSARKLRRSGANLLGGRALRCTLFPLVSAEIPDFDINRALNNGLLPRHYLSDDPSKRLQAYIGDYLQQEIIEEAVVRQLDAFTRFLLVAAMCNTEIVNYSNIAQDCGVSSKTVKEYFSILEETMLGFYLPAYSKNVKRRLIQSPKFYYFDVAIPNHLLHRSPLRPGTDHYGHALEHLIIQELRAFLSYRHGESKTLTYWRTLDNKYEVDALISDTATAQVEVAIEVKSSEHVVSADTKGLKAFGEEHPNAKLILLSMEEQPRKLNDVEVWPVKQFLPRLWAGKIVKG